MDYLEAFRAINNALSICVSILYGLNQKLQFYSASKWVRDINSMSETEALSFVIPNPRILRVCQRRFRDRFPIFINNLKHSQVSSE